MAKFTQKNQENIRHIVERKTGINLVPAKQTRTYPIKKLVLVAAMVLLCFLFTAFTYPLFSPLDGDMLSLSGQYQGEGIVSIQVVNGSEKKLEFQEQLKLISWKTGEVEPLDGKVLFENTAFEPHSSGTMTVDLSQAYPMEEIEKSTASNGYYLLLTNQDFLFGQDWICSLLFNLGTQTEEAVQEDIIIPAQNTDSVEPSLRFYFEDHYLDEVPAWNSKNGEYMEEVQNLLREQEGTLVHSVDPLLLVDVPKEIFGEDFPIMQNHFTLDSFNRIVSSMFPGNGQDCALTIGVPIPQYKGQTDGGIGGFYIRYFFTYLKMEAEQQDAYTFLSGRILDFASMEPYRVYEDEMYVVYDMTHLFFTELDDYIDDFVDAFGGDIYMDAQIRRNIHSVYDYLSDQDTLSFFYVRPPDLEK